MTINNGIWGFFNQKRLRDYPRLMFVCVWLILAVNVLLRTGWAGGFGQIIGGDFVVFYSTGLLYAKIPDSIYDFDQQADIQQKLVSPTVLRGLNPNINPPYVVPIYTLLSALPLTWSFITWTALSLLFVFTAVAIMMKILSSNIQNKGLTYPQLLILVLSFFPFIESILAGQNSSLTLFLMTCLIYFTLKEKFLVSGIFAGLMIYKPQYIIGFIVIWIVWKNLRSLASFALVVTLWVGSFYLLNGPELFIRYMDLSKQLLLLPYIEGFPAYLLVTFYGLLTTIFPLSTQPYLYNLTQLILVFSILFLGLYAYRLRHKNILERTPIITLAILLPLFAAPYTLLHDLVIVIPGFILWARYNPRRELLLAAIIVYTGAFILTFIGALSHIALNSLLVIGLFALNIWGLVKNNRLLYSLD